MLQLIEDPGPDPALRFIELAFGPHLPEFGYLPSELAGIEMPAALRRFYQYAGRRPGLFRQNSLRTPGMLSREADRVVFFDENQSVFEWATEVAGDDPAVWSREPGSHPEAHPELEIPDGPWVPEAAPLSSFLLQALLCEYTFGAAPATAGDNGNPIPPAELERVLAQLTEVPHGPWGPPDAWGFRFFVGPELVLQLDPGGFVWIGASSQGPISDLRLDAKSWSLG
jgi:hypothetical protein